MMKRRKLLVLLVILGLLAGNMARVPVVRAAGDNVFSGVMYGNLWTGMTQYVAFYANGDHVTWTGSNAAPDNTLGFGAGLYTSLVMSFSVDGVEHGQDAPWYMAAYTQHVGGGWDDNMTNFTIRFIPQAGSHSYSWYLSGYRVYGWVGSRVAWTGSVAAYDRSAYGLGGEGGGGAPGTGVWPVQGPSLSVTIAGPSAVDTTVGGTWTATAAGGTSPYTYLWSYGLTSGFPTNATTHYGSTLSAVLAPGTNTVQVNAADAAEPQGGAVDSVSVISADQVASYHILLQRVGSVGQYVEATAWDNTGQPVEITGTADSEIGIYYVAPDPVGFNWSAIDEAYAVVGSWAWRWSIWGGIQHEWFKSTITITDGHVIPVIAEFVGTGQNLDIWVSPDDIQIDPPVPPGVEEVEPDWVKTGKEILTWFFEQLKALLKILFVPTATDFSSQLASGWVLITSPVPTITPQYTIPFPNPNHLLAPTGDSVNIDFSVVQGYAGYSIMHTIVQVLMYAILVFIVLGIIT